MQTAHIHHIHTYHMSLQQIIFLGCLSFHESFKINLVLTKKKKNENKSVGYYCQSFPINKCDILKNIDCTQQKHNKYFAKLFFSVS